MKLDTPLTGAELRQRLEQYTESILGFAKTAGRSCDLQDIAQEVHARALRIDGSKLIENPLAYLYQITQHVIFDLTHSGANRLNGDAVPMETLTAAEIEEQPSLRVSDSSDHLNLQQQIGLALATLPLERAQVIICIKVQGMSYEQAAAHLGLTLGQVRHHIAEANKLLKKFPLDR